MNKEVKLEEIVDTGNISREPVTLDECSRDMSFVRAIRPEYVVRLSNAGDIEKLVNLAKETQTPLVPVSSGAPHLKGAAMGQLMGEAVGIALNSQYGVPHFISGDAFHDPFGLLSSNYHRWLQRLKKAFDLGGLSEATCHIIAKE